MRMHSSRFGPLHRALMWGSAAMVVAGTGTLGVAVATPTVAQVYQQVDTHGTFLPTSGPQRTVILGPDGKVYDTPTPGAGPPHPDPAFLQQVPGGPCEAENAYEGGYVTPKRYGEGC